MDEISLWDILDIFGRHKRKMTICFLLLMLTTVVVTFLLPSQFQSHAQLFVRLGRENVGLDPTATLGGNPSVNITPLSEQEIKSVAAMLRSRRFTEQVVDKLGPNAILDETIGEGGGFGVSTVLGAVKRFVTGFLPGASLSDRDKAIVKLERRVGIGAVKETNLVSIAYRSRDAEVSRQIVEALVDSYLDQHVTLHRASGTHKFLTNEKAKLHEELAADEAKLRDLKNKTGLIAPEEQRKTLVERVAKVKESLLQTEAEVAASEAEVEGLNELLARLAKTEVTAERSGVTNYAADGMRELLYELQLKAEQLLATHTEGHFKVRQIREQIRAAEAILAEEKETRTETTRAPSKNYLETELQLLRKKPTLRALDAKQEALNKQIMALRKEMERLNENELLVKKLAREVDISDMNYRKYAGDAEQARIDQSLESAKISNISIAQPATLDFYPVFPNVKLNLLVGFMVSLMASCGLAIFCESRKRSLDTA